MLVNVPTGQIEQYWEHIKLACLESDCIAPEHEQAYSLVLLQDLLDNTKHCVLGIKDNTIVLVFIYQLVYDAVTDKLIFWAKNLYGFEKLSDDDWAVAYGDLLKFVSGAGANVVKAEVGNPRLAQLVRQFSPCTEQVLFTIKL